MYRKIEKEINRKKVQRNRQEESYKEMDGQIDR